MTREYTIKEEGYVFMYVSNENATLVDVYFDDIVMTHTKGNVVQYNEYYPFGLQTANSWTRENNTGNNFLANGSTELNTTSNLYDLQYRNYDPVLGRMNQVDPMATKYASLTPYNFSFNDPVFYNDRNGADPTKEQKDIWEKDRIAATQAAHDAAWNSSMNNRYMYGVVGDDDLFPKYGPGDGGALRALDYEMAKGSHAASALRGINRALSVLGINSISNYAYWDFTMGAGAIQRYINIPAFSPIDLIACTNCKLPQGAKLIRIDQDGTLIYATDDTLYYVEQTESGFKIVGSEIYRVRGDIMAPAPWDRRFNFWTTYMGQDIQKFPGLKTKKQRDAFTETIGDTIDILFWILEKYKVIVPSPGPLLPGSNGVVPAELFLPIDWSKVPKGKG